MFTRVVQRGGKAGVSRSTRPVGPDRHGLNPRRGDWRCLRSHTAARPQWRVDEVAALVAFVARVHGVVITGGELDRRRGTNA